MREEERAEQVEARGRERRCGRCEPAGVVRVRVRDKLCFWLGGRERTGSVESTPDELEELAELGGALLQLDVVRGGGRFELRLERGGDGPDLVQVRLFPAC